MLIFNLLCIIYFWSMKVLSFIVFICIILRISGRTTVLLNRILPCLNKVWYDRYDMISLSALVKRGWYVLGTWCIILSAQQVDFFHIGFLDSRTCPCALEMFSAKVMFFITFDGVKIRWSLKSLLFTIWLDAKISISSKWSSDICGSESRPSKHVTL